MNPSLIARLEFDLRSSSKYNAANKIENGHNFGRKYRRGKRYAREQEEKRIEKMQRQQRKREKVNRDSWRREDLPSEKDEKIANLHYANFLGDKYGDNGAHYNNKLAINLKFCDSMRQETETETESFNDSLSDLSLGSDRDEEAEYQNYINIDLFLLKREQERQAQKVQEQEELRIEEQKMEEMYEYFASKRREQHYRDCHLAAVMANGYTQEEAELLVDYHESLNVGGWCDESLCPRLTNGIANYI